MRDARKLVGLTWMTVVVLGGCGAGPAESKPQPQGNGVVTLRVQDMGERLKLL